MKPDDFTDASPGRVIKTAQGYWAYIPGLLPPPLDLTWDLVREISEADRALSELAGVARTLPNPHLLISPFVRREAVLSSRIEGTQASLSDLFFFEASGSRGRPSDVREVANYVRALEYGLAWLARMERLPVSLRLIRELHARLTKGVGGDQSRPGEFRRSQNWIGPPGAALMDAVFVPPPVPEMNEALDKFEKFIHSRSSLPLLVRLALIHYQFEAIHPFLDGNGRIGRLLITLILCSEGRLSQPLLYLSAYFERHRQEYYRCLLAVSQSGRWLDWVIFFLRGVAEQAHDAIRRAGRLLELRDRYRRRLEAARASSLLLKLTDDLFVRPATTISEAARRLSVTHRSAALNISKLVRAGIVKESTGRRRNRLYVAPEIMEIIERPKAD